MYLGKILLTLVLVCGGVAGGCCGGGGADVKTENQMSTTTLGSELRDLKEAYDQGIISEKEYNEARERIIKQRTKGK